MIDLAISIINYKTKQLTAKCLESILKKKWSLSIQIWLVDNASEDGSVEFFKEQFPQVKIIQSAVNLGFAGGHNLALTQIKARYVLILNSDTEVLDDSLDEMVEFMDRYVDVGISSCKVLDFDGKLQPNGGDLPFGIALLNWLFNLESIGLISPSFHRNDKKYYQTVHEVGWVSGNFIMVRGEVVKKIGFFNEEYFMYFEDVDYCFRAKRAEFKIVINPDASIKHLSGGSLDDPHLRQWTGEFRGLIHFYQQQFGSLAGLVIRLLIYLSALLRIIAFILTGKVNYAQTYTRVITAI